MLTALLVKLLVPLGLVSGALPPPSAPPGAPIASASSASGTGGTAPAPGATPQQPLSPQRLLGQRIMVGFSGTAASPALLRAVQQGRVGSVILFSSNIGTRAQLRSLTASLQRAARAGHNPPLLVATDQEGGQVKRLPNGPPDLSPPQIARTGSTTVASREGRATGRYLKGLGINMDLAPVADVPTFRGAFIWQQGRAFSFSAPVVASYANAFARGLQSAHVAAVAKHFPGLGSAPISTDSARAELHPTRVQRQAALEPYRRMIPRGLDAVMMSLAGFPAYDRSGMPAALSRPILRGLLRNKLHFAGVTITDGLGAPTGFDEITAGVRAATAGSDILLYTDSAPGELSSLERALRTGKLSRAEATACYERIVRLKRQVIR